jgi:hypothetical protein
MPDVVGAETGAADAAEQASSDATAAGRMYLSMGFLSAHCTAALSRVGLAPVLRRNDNLAPASPRRRLSLRRRRTDR